MPLDRDDGAPAPSAAAPPPAPPSEFEQKITKFLLREVPDSCIVKGVVRSSFASHSLVLTSVTLLHRSLLSWAAVWGFYSADL